VPALVAALFYLNISSLHATKKFWRDVLLLFSELYRKVFSLAFEVIVLLSPAAYVKGLL
jgi:hypothetical protein